MKVYVSGTCISIGASLPIYGTPVFDKHSLIFFSSMMYTTYMNAHLEVFINGTLVVFFG
jgi:hypothetical protein